MYIMQRRGAGGWADSADDWYHARYSCNNSFEVWQNFGLIVTSIRIIYNCISHKRRTWCKMKVNKVEHSGPEQCQAPKACRPVSVCLNCVHQMIVPCLCWQLSPLLFSRGSIKGEEACGCGWVLVRQWQRSSVAVDLGPVCCGALCPLSGDVVVSKFFFG